MGDNRLTDEGLQAITEVLRKKTETSGLEWEVLHEGKYHRHTDAPPPSRPTTGKSRKGSAKNK